MTVSKGLNGGYESKLRGEAIIVHLLKGRIYALLAGRSANDLPTSFDNMSLIPETLFGDIGRGKAGKLPIHNDRIEDLNAIKLQPGLMRSLDCRVPGAGGDVCPFFVRFEDSEDVTSIQPLYPEKFEEELGAGVVLKLVRVEITDDPVSRNDERDMPPYKSSSDFVRWYGGLSVEDPRRVTQENFAQ
ncbi:hypothetical protein [Sphingomonas sp. PAMC 26621]|uniref:hypothetical protein n=1 Tax=Sphingomonas sp. PAMC 26621 TaxID=1112213 RepID=UPI0011110963|nr:hypothetical protein [Sphingomonas sp. PAMC 26621]